MQPKSWNDFIYSKLKRINKLSWKTKLMTLFTLVLVASLILQIFYIIPFIQDRELENTEFVKKNEASFFAREAEMGLDQLEGLLLDIAGQSIFQNMDIDNQTEVLLQYVNILPEIGSLSVINNTGWFVSGTLDNFDLIYTTKSYANRPYFIVPFEQGQIYYGNPWWYGSKPDVVGCTIAVPINLDTGETVGVLMGTLHLNSLLENVANYPFEEDSVAFLVSSNGMVIAHSEIDLFALEEGPRSLNYSSDYMVQEVITGNAGTHECSHIYDRNGTIYYGHAILLDYSNWGAIVITPMSNIRAPTVILVNNLWLYNIVLFSGALIVTFIFAQQITKQQKRAEEQLIRNERLTILGKIAGGISHELRNPLGAIKNSVYFLNMVLEEPEPDVKSSLEILDKEIVTAENIITSILDFARSKPPKLSKVDIKDLIERTLSKITVPDNIKVINQFDKALVSIQADPDQLTQVLTNLFTNAIQAMPEGGQMIIKSDNSSPNWVMISIKDTGVGIPKENQEKLFEPLFTTKAKGIGLGLAVTRTLIESHGGTIEAQSEIGRGSTFTFKLPISNNGG